MIGWEDFLNAVPCPLVFRTHTKAALPKSARDHCLSNQNARTQHGHGTAHQYCEFFTVIKICSKTAVHNLRKKICYGQLSLLYKPSISEHFELCLFVLTTFYDKIWPMGLHVFIIQHFPRFLPPLKEESIKSEGPLFLPDIKRKELFTSKTFIFLSSKQVCSSSDVDEMFGNASRWLHSTKRMEISQSMNLLCVFLHISSFQFFQTNSSVCMK
jgi:hypothetical protein